MLEQEVNRDLVHRDPSSLSNPGPDWAGGEEEGEEGGRVAVSMCVYANNFLFYRGSAVSILIQTF